MIDKYCSIIKMEMLAAMILVAGWGLTGCNKRLEAPEIIDPIYNEILKEQKRVEKELAENEKLLKDKRDELLKAQVRTITRARVQKEVREAEQKMQQLTQEQRYYELRAQKRKFLDRETYKRALTAGVQWPDPEEYKRYLAYKRLRNASRNWDARVPKLTERYARKDESLEQK